MFFRSFTTPKDGWGVDSVPKGSNRINKKKVVAADEAKQAKVSVRLK
jgi:hypothetical protein